MPDVGGKNGWECVLWWKSICQVNALAGIDPSSLSVAVPANVNVCPALYLVPAIGRVIVGVGRHIGGDAQRRRIAGRRAGMFVTRRRKRSPLSASVVVLVRKRRRCARECRPSRATGLTPLPLVGEWAAAGTPTIETRGITDRNQLIVRLIDMMGGTAAV